MSLFTLILITLNIFFMYANNSLGRVVTILNDIEYLSSSTQRIIKLSIEDRPTEQILKDINNMINIIKDKNIKNIKNNNIEYSIKVTSISEDMLNEIISDWYDIERILNQENLNKEQLYFSGERHFYNCNEVSNNLKDYILNTNISIKNFNIINVICIILISLLSIKNFFYIKQELAKNKKITKSMFLDSATGLYDRSRCQELFNEDFLEEVLYKEKKSKIVIIFDLNDLKKTNDTYGHKIGDELIETFANILKQATKIHKKEPFLGRYGGDEFIVYYDNEDIIIINKFLEEVDNLRKEYNKKEKRYQISYAVGYDIANKTTGIKSFRELFDKADNNMYENKKLIKNN